MNLETKSQEMINLQLKARGITNKNVLAAFSRVPRERFVAKELRAKAYEDVPLSIKCQQTISQPYIVALTMQELQLRPSDKLLDVGTGSGYAAAVAAQIVREVVSIERHETLANNAKVLLEKLNYTNIKVIHGDGAKGFAAEAPYNAISVSACAEQVPHALLEQLAVGGRMIIPVGNEFEQSLKRIVRVSEDRYETQNLIAVRYVPLVTDN